MILRCFSNALEREHFSELHITSCPMPRFAHYGTQATRPHALIISFSKPCFSESFFPRDVRENAHKGIINVFNNTCDAINLIAT